MKPFWLIKLDVFDHAPMAHDMRHVGVKSTTSNVIFFEPDGMSVVGWNM